MAKQYRSDMLAVVHETAAGLRDAGVIDRSAMTAFDDLCLTPIEPLTAAQIRRIRLREKESQAVFARYLNVTTGLISQWERGEKHPRGASLNLLTLVAKKGLQSVA
jgi:putative transcriptional regulator